jgi:hypothetical protein
MRRDSSRLPEVFRKDNLNQNVSTDIHTAINPTRKYLLNTMFQVSLSEPIRPTDI